MATIIIPTPLRKFTEGRPKIAIAASTVQEALQGISGHYPELKKHLLDETGQIRPFLNIFVGEDDIRDLQAGATALPEGAVVSIIPAIAGGNLF